MRWIVTLLALLCAPGFGFAQSLPSPSVATPTQPDQAANKAYVDAGDSGRVSIGGSTINGPLVWLNQTPTQNTTYAQGGLTNGVIIAAGGNRVSYCPPMSCVTLPSADHQRTSALFWSTTSDDGHSEEQTVAIQTIIATGYARPWLPGTAYGVGDNVQFPAANTVYRAIQAGTSASNGTGPTGKTADIVDGTVHWAWVNDQRINAKVGLYTETVVTPGAGQSWGQANNVSLRPGVVPSFNINTEMDFTNDAAECVIGTANCNVLEMSVGGAYRSTQGIHLSSPNTGPTYATHWGIRLNGFLLASDADIEVDSSAPVGLGFNASGLGGSHTVATIQDNSTGPTGYLVTATHSSADFAVQSASPAAFGNTGSHALGTIFDNSASPVVVNTSGTHAAQTWGDTSITPAALNLNGTYSLGAITTQNSTSANAILTKDDQNICFNATDACIKHSGGKLIYTVGGVQLFSVSDVSGNAVFRGTVTARGTP